jgi:acetyl esterase/lipase
MVIIMIILAYIFSGLALLMSIMLLINLRSPFGWFIIFPKLIAEGLPLVWIVLGVVGAAIGWFVQALWAIPMGIIGAGIMIWYIRRTTRDHDGFENAFGGDWSDQIQSEQTRHMVQKRWTWFLKMKSSPEPIWERDIPFWIIPGTDQELLCDIWRPGEGNVSGLALVYLHGGAWTIGDKDFGTRPFFRHLVSQGHTVMDVAYRLCPEVDIIGMVGDVKRAIAWMKANANHYDVNSDKIVLCGASAGGNLAQLVGYTPHHRELTPEDVRNADLSVRGVISYYGPTDFLTFYHYSNLQVLEGKPLVPIGAKLDTKARFSIAARLDILLGGWPQDAPYVYQLTSSFTHVHPGCPPTLLIQGEHDHVASTQSTYALYTKLVENGVPAINVVYPWTDHAFDLLFPQVNPAAQSALYDVDRFLAILLNKE